MRVAVLLAAALGAAAASDFEDFRQEPDRDYTNMWVAEVHGGEDVVRRIARDYGYTYEGPATPFEDHYILTRDDHPKVSKRNSRGLTKSLLDLDEVKWAEQQALLKRSLRGYEQPHHQN